MQPILTIDLTTGEINEFLIPLEWERLFFGGATLAARILYDYLVPDLSHSLPNPLCYS